MGRMDRWRKSTKTFSFCSFHSAILLGRMGKSTKTFSICSFCSFCYFANFTVSFCQLNGQNGKIDKKHFQSAHFAHSAILLTLPFQSASRMGRMRKSTDIFILLILLLFHSASRMNRMGKSTKTFSFCSFCYFANFTVSFCQQNGQNETIDRHFSFCSFCQFANFTISFCSFCQFANFTILFCSFCQFANFTEPILEALLTCTKNQGLEQKY